jgi:hypothetical protein
VDGRRISERVRGGHRSHHVSHFGADPRPTAGRTRPPGPVPREAGEAKR